jgi:hypothetical protein
MYREMTADGVYWKSPSIACSDVQRRPGKNCAASLFTLAGFMTTVRWVTDTRAYQHADSGGERTNQKDDHSPVAGGVFPPASRRQEAIRHGGHGDRALRWIVLTLRSVEANGIMFRSDHYLGDRGLSQPLITFGSLWKFGTAGELF